MYLNHTTEYFSDLISQVSLTDEKKIIQKIFSFALQLLHKLFDINCLFFYEFFDQVNASECYVIYSGNPKFGPYCGSKHSLEIIMFNF